MDITLRQETSADYDKMENLMREAFWNVYGPGCFEHYLLHIMRDCPAFVPELSIAAEADGVLAGGAMCTKAGIEGDNGKRYETLCLGPIGVLPEFQGKGIGGKMLACAAERALKMGFTSIFLTGDPAYYSRYGFLPAARFGIRTADNRYAAALQVMELKEGALTGKKGRYLEDSLFEIREQDAMDFDEKFPKKEKLSDTPSQKRFLALVPVKAYFLETERLGFSVWTGDDLKLAELLWGEADVTRLICASGVFTKEDIKNRLKTEVENWEKYHVQYFPFFERSTGDLIGCCGLRPLRNEAGEVVDGVFELGFHLRSAYWGKGFATEAGQAVVSYAFSELGAKELKAGHNPENTASRAALKKLGFWYIGDHFYEPTGLYHPSYRMRKEDAHGQRELQ